MAVKKRSKKKTTVKTVAERKRINQTKILTKNEETFDMVEEIPKELIDMRGAVSSKYRPEFCQMMVDDMAKGYSFEAFAGLIGVHKETMYQWVKKHPDFAEAKKRAFDANRRYWEKVGIEQSSYTGTSKHGSSSSFIFNMKNRFDWVDKKETKLDAGENTKGFLAGLVTESFKDDEDE